jgi:microcystin-dependent protein
VPRASVFYVATATTPAGYLYCDGTTIPTSGTFQGIAASLLQDLRTLLGTSYGATGTLPNLVNRFAGYSATPSPGAGSANAVLIAHTHSASSTTTISPNPHNHSVTTNRSGSTESGNGDNGGADSNDSTGDKSLSASTTTTITAKGINAAGGNSPTQTGTNANLPPYTGMRPIIKY